MNKKIRSLEHTLIDQNIFTEYCSGQIGNFN
jgi:hypothetical protein